MTDTTALPLRSGEVARQCGLTYTYLYSLLRTGRISTPPRDSAGQLCWNESHLAEIRQFLAARKRFKQVVA